MARIADVVIRGGTLLDANQQERQADLLIAGEQIVAVQETGSGRGHEAIDATGLVVVPGAVDMHVHLREPGLTHKEDVDTGTRAAACGGITTVCDMPNTIPPVTTSARLRDKMRIIEPSCWVDVGLWAGGTLPDELERMRADGAVGVKIYMVKGAGFDELYTGDDATLRAVLDTVAHLNWFACAHVGDDDVTGRERDALIRSGRRDPWAFVELQRGDGSILGLRRFLDAASCLSVRAHVAHLSVFGVAALEVVRAYREAGLQVTVESCVPALSTADLDRVGVFGLATALDDEAADVYWSALATGEIDAIATDHAPHTRAEKEPGMHDVWAAPPGHPALETSLPLAFDAVLRGRLLLARMVDAMARKPASLLRLPRKGQLSAGFDADLVLLDPSASWRVDESSLHSKVGWSPFHGRELRGRVHSTFLRGRLVARGGEIVGESPTGRILRVTADGSTCRQRYLE